MNKFANEWDVSQLNLDQSLLDELEKLEPEPETIDEPDAPEPDPKDQRDEQACNALAAMIVDSFEMTVQTFGHEQYALDAGKKALLVANYTNVLSKYQNTTTHFLGKYTEEILAALVTVFVIVMTHRTVKELKAQDRAKAQKPEKAKTEKDHGQQSEHGAEKPS
ncbi:hypothetical protein [Vibrio coralliilyticus]|uniref:hypothetical protein n=1 Tax=Vibrio coralliilyticus TaxID=190893 RepID=UPI0017D9147F|nr:hypothetical protein [Vibrio coralliilyticus]NUW69560.1 hypothetical protein [Vibrio coralliilyticus]